MRPNDPPPRFDAVSASDRRRLVAELARRLDGQSLADRVDDLERLLGTDLCRQLAIYRLPPGFLLSVVIPVYNEEQTIGEVLRRVRDCGLPIELIVVDDASTDGTGAALEALLPADDLRVVHLPHNQGKGAAIKLGFELSRGTVVLVQDADLEYDPAEYWRLVQPLVAGQADAVYGSRFRGDSRRVDPFWHFLGNQALTLLSNLFTNLHLTDMETCYKVFRGDLIRQIAPTLRERRFGIEPELTARLARVPQVRVFERPIRYAGRSYAQGKKIGWRDGLWAVWCIVRYGLGR